MRSSFSWGISQRLMALAVVMTVALAGLAALAYVKLESIKSDARQTGQARLAQLSDMAEVELSITQASLELRHAMLARNPDEMQRALSTAEARRKTIADLVAGYEKRLFSEGGKARYKELPPLLEAFWGQVNTNTGLIRAAKKDEAFAHLADTLVPARDALLKSIDNSVEFQRDALRGDIGHIEAEAQQTLLAILAVAVGLVLCVATLSWHVARVLRMRVGQAASVAEQVGRGDLSQRVDDERRDEFTPLLAALSSMRENLTRVVSGVRQNADSVSTAATQIAQGNQDLSGRTEQQAAALEETASSMEELGSTVKQNADNARQASQLAMSASTVAVQGGDVVAQVVETMKGINDSSKKIADIITVIDGIAFQTNILALNAAVEAARAGEQGRGFAVVAGEVRSLAQRSAEAAKEIKSLITTSVERVGQGTELVDRAGRTMQEVVASIKRVTDIMGEISAASAEQSAGVAQVGQAVTQMDQATQQNAALVEQSAAAAESLKGQAQRLVQAVAAFRLEAAENGARAWQAEPRAAMALASPRSEPAPARATRGAATLSAAGVAATSALLSSSVTSPAYGAPVDLAPATAPAPAASPASAALATAGDDDWTTF